VLKGVSRKKTLLELKVTRKAKEVDRSIKEVIAD